MTDVSTAEMMVVGIADGGDKGLRLLQLMKQRLWMGNPCDEEYVGVLPQCRKLTLYVSPCSKQMSVAEGTEEELEDEVEDEQQSKKRMMMVKE